MLPSELQHKSLINSLGSFVSAYISTRLHVEFIIIEEIPCFLASLINLLLLNTLHVKSETLIPKYCNLIEFPFNLNQYVSPAFNSMFIAFTLAYLYMPMQFISGMNYPVILFITGLLVLDGGTKVMGGCTTFGGVALGTLVGLVLGLLWFVAFYYTNHKDLLYFNAESSNNVVCSRPSKQTFKCRIFKNGEIIGESTKQA